MRIRLGYVAISLNLKNASTSKTISVAAFNKLQDHQSKIFRLNKILQENLNNTLRILRYNKAYNIKVYRLTSKLVPLATHPLTNTWDYIKEFKSIFEEIGNYIKENNMRISAHPDHYTVINTNNPAVFESSLKDLEYHHGLFNAMGLDNNYKLVVHVGGQYKDKTSSIARFIEGYNNLPKEIAKRIILENDDKIYNAYDVLEICNKIKIPMVLDVHHHYCNNNGNGLEPILKDIFDTWKNEKFPPKIHFSSPKNEKTIRSHADDINFDDFIKFIKSSKKLNKNFDIMLEAKNKDLALIKLMHQVSTQSDVKIIDESEFEI